MLVTVNLTSLSERQLLSQMGFFSDFSDTFQNARLFPYRRTPQVLGESTVCASSSAQLLLAFWCFLAQKGCFLLAFSRESFIRLFCGKKPHRSMVLVSIKSQVLVKGVIPETGAFLVFYLGWGQGENFNAKDGSGCEEGLRPYERLASLQYQKCAEPFL